MNITKEISKYMAVIGKKGGKRSLETMTLEQRKQRSQKAVRAREKNKKVLK